VHVALGSHSSWTTLSLGVPSRTSAPTPVPDQNVNFQIILGKVRPLTSPRRGPSTGSDHCSRADHGQRQRLFADTPKAPAPTATNASPTIKTPSFGGWTRGWIGSGPLGQDRLSCDRSGLTPRKFAGRFGYQRLGAVGGLQRNCERVAPHSPHGFGGVGGRTGCSGMRVGWSGLMLSRCSPRWGWRIGCGSAASA
jgi:hypothetical protein